MSANDPPLGSFRERTSSGLTEIFGALIVRAMTDDLAHRLSFGAALAGASEQWRETFRREMTARSLASAAGASGDVLIHLHAGAIPQTVLTVRTGLSKQAVQQLLDQLEAASLVRREVDPKDKRAKQVMLTDSGRQALAERQHVMGQLEADLRERLGKKQFKALRRLLREIAGG
jgi:DNA-binding MarR family transcriptional regulator